MVCSMTLGPAKPIRAPGSARMISPSMAKLAVTPPVVGSVSTLTKSWPASWWRFKAAAVLAICIRETIPSCILAPPEQAKSTTGSFSLVARSTALVIFSPTLWPMLLIRNLASQTPITAGLPPILPQPVTMASLSLDFSLAASSFFSYPGKFKGLETSISRSHSSKVPGSVTIWSLLQAWTRK